MTAHYDIYKNARGRLKKYLRMRTKYPFSVGKYNADIVEDLTKSYYPV